jgi:hypothetical protein
VGPTLGAAPYNVPGVLADPQFRVVPLGQDFTVASNDNWGGTAALQAAFAQTYAFALPADSRDAAVVVRLPPGGYTVQATGVGDTTGNVLVEVYDMDPSLCDPRRKRRGYERARLSLGRRRSSRIVKGRSKNQCYADDSPINLRFFINMCKRPSVLRSESFPVRPFPTQESRPCACRGALSLMFGLLLLVGGCASAPESGPRPADVPRTQAPDRFGALQKGMTAEEVRSLVGEPKEIKPLVAAGLKGEDWLYDHTV